VTGGNLPASPCTPPGEGRRPRGAFRLRSQVWISCLLAGSMTLSGCGDGSPPPTPTTDRTTPAAAPAMNTERTFERSFAFVADLGDSLLLVPWVVRHDATPDSVHREVGGWLARAGTWEPFYRERWVTGPTRAPQRILPHTSLGLVVREGDIVDGLVYREGPRSLEVAMGNVRAAWIAPNGETLDVLEAALYLSDERIDGLLLDLARSWTPDGTPHGDWAFLVSGDSVTVALTADQEHGLEQEPIYRAWAQHGGGDLRWPEVRLTWSDRQAFPPARRDVPTAWTLASADGSLGGVLQSVSADMEAGAGPGPLLPVRALIEVTGTITTGGARFPVRGILVHQRR